MTGRFAGVSPLTRLVMAAMAVAGATAVAVAMTRDTTPDSRPEAALDGDRAERSDMAPGTGTIESTTTVLPTPAAAVPTTAEPATGPGQTAESPFEIDGVFRWLWADPADIRFVWRDETGNPYGQLQAGREALEDRGERVVVITNGGIHRPGLIPSGLYVEDGAELTPLNQGSGSGNFFLQPNGVFWIGDGVAGVDTTEEYAAGAGGRMVHAAVQSGPMLVIDSVINPAFSESSTSTHRRNAVGVDAEGRVLLIMAERAVTLWAMADRCRELGAVAALYLDGTLSRLEYAVDGKSIFPNLPVATMIAVVDGETDSAS